MGGGRWKVERKFPAPALKGGNFLLMVNEEFWDVEWFGVLRLLYCYCAYQNVHCLPLKIQSFRDMVS